MKLFGFFRRRASAGPARLIRIETSGITPEMRNEMRERLRELSGKAEQKRSLRNRHLSVATGALAGRLVVREVADEGDRRLAA